MLFGRKIELTLKGKKIILLAADILAVAAGFFMKSLATLMLDKLPDCYLAARSLPCPACGGTRCVYNFFSLNFAAAFQYNPCVFVVIIFMLILAILLNLWILFGIKWAEKAFKAATDYRVIILLTILFIFFGIIRYFF